MSPREHGSIPQAFVPRLMALPLPDWLVVDLDGLVGVLEYYEYRADCQQRHETAEAMRKGYTGEFLDVLFPEWGDDGRMLSQEKADGGLE